MKLPSLRDAGTEARLLLIGIPVFIWTMLPIYHMFLFAISPKEDAFRDLLPESIREFTELHIVPDPENAHQSLRQGGGHHGSHPHLVHEFIASIVEEREPWINAATAANWTAAGICAHQSAMESGAEIIIPSFDQPSNI